MIKKKLILVSFFVLIFFIVDRCLKEIALAGKQGRIFFIRFTLFKNPYIAFGIPFRGIFLYVLIALILYLLTNGLIRTYRKKDPQTVLALGLILLGAWSNLGDRIRWGVVIDYLYWPGWTAFNLADAMIVVGLLILAYRLIRGKTRSQT